MRYTLRELEERLRMGDTWDSKCLIDLAWYADMEEEWAAADGETFEAVIYAMAEKVEISLHI